MSDYTSIRGVTLSLKTLLEDRLKATPLSLTLEITVSRPDVKQTLTGNRLNLFLYQVVENHGLANQEDPRIGTTRDYGHPPLSLNLRYLLTTYATDTDETEAHKVLGAAMHVMHENTILTPSVLRTPPPTPPLPVLDSSLLGAREHLRLSLLPLTLDDISKIWIGAQESLRLSVAYEVTVIQIESVKPRVSPLPVRERNVVVTTGGPKIASVEPNVLGIGDTFTITGSSLFSQTTKVFIDSAMIDLSGLGAPTLRSDRIQTALPNVPVPVLSPAPDPALWPGPHVLRVTVGFDESNSLATSAFPKSMTSNPIPVLVVPKITSVAPATAPGGSTHTLTINGQRLYRAQDDANIFVLIADQTIPASQFTIKTDTQIQVTAPDLPPGRYPVHVRFNAFVSQDDAPFTVT